MLKVAQIQTNPKLCECEENVNRIGVFLQESIGADLIVLPELANSGYNFENRDQAMSCATDHSHHNYIDYLREFSIKNKVYIVSGVLEKEKDELFNTSVLLCPDGTMGKYRKMHLFMNEKNIFSPGNIGLPVFNIGEYRIGMLICFDYLFPEIWRIMALKNADIIAHPSNLVTQNAHKVIPAQAIINGYFVLTTNRVGTDGDLAFCGNSFIVDPRGNKLVEFCSENEQVIITSINPLLSRDKMITPNNHIINDRKTDDYLELLEL